jgi:SAM-dependent methyltransferase
MSLTAQRMNNAQQLLISRGKPSYCFQQIDVCPAEAVYGLEERSERLMSLRTAYERFGCPACNPGIWQKEYIKRDLPFSAFRDDCAFVWQRRENAPANYILSAEYLLKGKYRELFLKLEDDGLFGAQFVQTEDGLMITRDRIDSTIEIAFIDELFSISKRRQFSILDIGAGYGRLGVRMVNAFDSVTVTCADAVAESTFICEHYLRFRSAEPRARAVPLHQLADEIENHEIDIALSVHSFSECSIGAVCWWLALLRRLRIRYLLIIPNAGAHGGQLLLAYDGAGRRTNIQGVIETYGYRRIAYVPKYHDQLMQEVAGVSPTYYHLFELERRSSIH